MKTIFITGATSGIGCATARKMASRGYRLILTGRNSEKLLRLCGEIKATVQSEILPLVFDVCDKAACGQAIKSLPVEWSQIDVLVNNAGLALGLDPLHEGDVLDWEKMIDTNLKGLLYVTRLVAPQMVARKSGHIVNLGSTASREVYEGGNVYCATKHAVLALSQAMRTDFLPYGIKVTQIAPGAVETNFSTIRFHGDRQRAGKVYEGYEPLVAEDVADAIDYAVSRPPHVCINEIILTPTAQFNGKIYKG